MYLYALVKVLLYFFILDEQLLLKPVYMHLYIVIKTSFFYCEKWISYVPSVL